MTRKRPRTPTWQIVSRTLGSAIVVTVMVGWQRGQSISDPGVLSLLGIAAWLLGVNVYATIRRNGGSGSPSKSGDAPPPPLRSESD